MSELPVIPKGHCYIHVLVLQKGEETYAEALFDMDSCFRWGYDEKIIEDVEAWLPLPKRGSEDSEKSPPAAWMADRIDSDGFDQEVPAVTWQSPEEQKFFHQQMGYAPDKFRMCLIPLYRNSCETLLDTTPGSTLKVMRGPGGGLYLSGVEDLREGDVFRREVRG